MSDQDNFDAKKRAAADAYKQRKDNARGLIMNFMNSPESNNIPGEIKSAILYLSGKGVRTARVGATSAFKVALLEGPMTGLQIYEKFDIGTPTVLQRIRGFVNAKNPEDRVFVELIDGKYTVVGQGAEPPAGYSGPLPKVKVETEVEIL